MNDTELPSNERRLFSDGHFYHADGKARFLFEAPRPMTEPPNSEYPLILLTGRGTAVQWHTQTRTGKSAVLRKLAPSKAYAEINPLDARRLGIRPQQTVMVESRRASIAVVAFLSHSVAPGQVFVPMHYPEVNQLTDAVFDPYSKQPSYKACAVRLALRIERCQTKKSERKIDVQRHDGPVQSRSGRTP
jgi:assimilatory nitrate reductase catalytic subunit